MEVGTVLNTQDGNVAGAKIKAAEMAMGNVPRKKFSDISNLPQQNQDMRLQSVSLDAKDYVHKLHQENLLLVKLLEDRNVANSKIIQLHAMELQKLRTKCQQLQQKNLQLAQTNSQMLAELNSSKDRLKVLQHELGCKNGLLKASKLESKNEAKRGREVETIEHDKIGKFAPAYNSDNEHCNKKRMRRSKSLDPAIVKPVQTKQKVDKKRQSASFKAGKQEPTDDVFEKNEALLLTTSKPIQAAKEVNSKRLCSRRRSARFKAGEQEPTDDVFEISHALDPSMVATVQDETNVDSKRLCSRRQSARLISQEQVQEPTEGLVKKDVANSSVSPLLDHGPTSSVPSVKDESEATHCASGYEAQDLRRPSVRPKRQAAEKVQSYKEIPLTVKMRRPD